MIKMQLAKHTLHRSRLCLQTTAVTAPRVYARRRDLYGGIPPSRKQVRTVFENSNNIPCKIPHLEKPGAAEVNLTVRTIA